MKSARYVIVPLIIALIILYLCCFIPIKNIPDVELDWDIPIDKIVHFLMYLGLSSATAINYIHGEKGNIQQIKLFVGAILLPILYGGIIEIIQAYFCVGRSGDWFDFLADLIGSLTALPIALFYQKHLLKKHYSSKESKP